MSIRRLALVSALMLGSSGAHAVGALDVMGSTAKGVHTFFCTGDLLNSLRDKGAAAKAMVGADFSRIRNHNARLREMGDEEFSEYMSGEVWKVARCHPVASELIGNFPGKDFLGPLNTVASVPGSADRKVTYAIWGYNWLYRSLNGFISELKPGTSALVDADLEAAKQLAEKLRQVTPQEVADGAGPSQIMQWMGTQGEDDVSGAVRPTVPVYALVGRQLVMYEVETVHLMFPSSNGPGQYCYERYNPDFPKFARLFNAGRAEQQAEAVLSEQEASELLKFFNSAAGVNANSFILSDLAAVAISEGDAGNGNALANCVRLAQQEAFGDENDSLRWERGSVVHFAEDDKTWQTLMMMLAAKRIEVAQESVAD